MFPSSLDIEALRTISAETGGRFLPAGDVAALEAAFRDIASARKAEFRVRTRLVTTELFPWALGPALALLLLAAPAWPVGARLPTRPAAP